MFVFVVGIHGRRCLYLLLKLGSIKVQIMQSWSLLDFGELGLDVVETAGIEYPQRSDLCNSKFNFKDPAEVVYVGHGSSSASCSTSRTNKKAKKRYVAKVLRFGGRSHKYTVM